MCHSRPIFLKFCLFNTFNRKQMFNINFADDWIRTADLWYWKQLLYQLSQIGIIKQLTAMQTVAMFLKHSMSL